MEKPMVTKILTTNKIVSGPHDAIDFDQPNETWIIDPGVLAYSHDQYGTFSNFEPNNRLVNFGKVVAANIHETGVYLNDGNASVVNEVGAEILGHLRGVFLDGNGTDAVVNRGKIIGASNAGAFVGPPPGVSAGVEFYKDAGSVFLNNQGFIFGQIYGVDNLSLFSGGTINNTAIIKSTVAGISVDTQPVLVTHITNAIGGVISGGLYGVVEVHGHLHLLNHGTINGSVVTENNNSVIINDGKINGEVFLGLGNSLFNGTGGTSGEIDASVGNNKIIAGNGSVKIDVGSGNNTITGGPGHDAFIFDSALASQVDNITNFKPGFDKIVLSATDFAGIGPVGGLLAAADFHVGLHPTAPSQHIIYDAADGFLFYVGASGGQLHFATLSPNLALTHDDFFVVA
jgi:Ca2+-binding RTX toxin-like protein